MTVRIMLDLDRLHFVVDGVRHRALLGVVPLAGERVKMDCGVVDEVEYTTTPDEAVKTCWPCDLSYRRRLGQEIPPNHPALGVRPLLRPVPKPRS